MHVIRDSEDDTTFQKFYEKTGIQLTEEPNPVPPSLRNKIEDLHFEVYVNPKATIPELIKLTGKYPEIPVLKNYLFLAYSLCNKNKKAEKLLDETIKKHPNYIFGISNKILNIDDHDELLTHGHLLGNPRDVRELVGYDKPIHIIAYISYQQAAAHYEAHIGEDDAAVKRLDNLIELDAPEDILDRIAITIARSRFLNVSKKFKKQIQVKGKQIVYLNQQWKERPKLNHPELEVFYTTHPEDLGVERRDYIMSLPKETLVLDLENILLESMLRWEYYRYTDWDENTHNFLLHALYFLGALKSEQSLPKVLELLKMGEEFVDYWFADTFESILLPTLFALSEKQLDELFEIAITENIRGIDKIIVAIVVAQIALHQPERRSEVLEWYVKVFENIISNADNNNLFDTSFLNFMIADVIDFRGSELLPYIEKINKNDWLDEQFQGDIEAIKISISKEPCASEIKPLPIDIHEYYTKEYLDRQVRRKPTQETLDIFERMNSRAELYVSSMWTKTLNKADELEDYDYETTGTIRNEQPKTGRNEPCPCGSGKKYKKCCLRK